MPTIYVFEDGETWSAAPPTAVVLTDEQLQRLIESGGKVQAVIDEDEEDEGGSCETCDKKCGEEEGKPLLYGSLSVWLCADCYAKEAPDVLGDEEDKKSANSSTYGEGCRRICRKCGEECSYWHYNGDHEVICEDCEKDDEKGEEFCCTECDKKGFFCDGIEKCDRCGWAACYECDAEGKQIGDDWVCSSCQEDSKEDEEK